MSINYIAKDGRITGDIEERQAGDSKVANFSIATDNGYMKDGQWVKKTEFYNCKVWNKLMESMKKNVAKGDFIYIDGRTEIEKWEDKDGGKHEKMVIVIGNYSLVRKKGISPWGPSKDNNADNVDGHDIPPGS